MKLIWLIKWRIKAKEGKRWDYDIITELFNWIGPENYSIFLSLINEKFPVLLVFKSILESGGDWKVSN